MPNNFKNINYGRMLFESLRKYFAVNSDNDISIIYRYLAAFVALFQVPFETFTTFRNKEALIANCKWQIGQLTNVLNYIYDVTLSRIFITQSVLNIIADPTFQYTPIHSDGTFAMAVSINESGFTDRVGETIVAINIPSDVATASLSDLTATVNQINLSGIPYGINIF